MLLLLGRLVDIGLDLLVQGVEFFLSLVLNLLNLFLGFGQNFLGLLVSFGLLGARHFLVDSAGPPVEVGRLESAEEGLSVGIREIIIIINRHKEIIRRYFEEAIFRKEWRG